MARQFGGQAQAPRRRPASCWCSACRRPTAATRNAPCTAPSSLAGCCWCTECARWRCGWCAGKTAAPARRNGAARPARRAGPQPPRAAVDATVRRAQPGRPAGRTLRIRWRRCRASRLPAVRRRRRRRRSGAGAAGRTRRETRQFRAVTEAALESQAGHIVYLRAMAGVGKSRLSAEFADIARQAGFGCHRCEVLDAGADDWRAPLGQLARSLLGMGAGRHRQRRRSTTASPNCSWRRSRRSSIAALTGARMTSDQVSLYAAMSHAVRDQGMAQALQLLIMRRARGRAAAAGGRGRALGRRLAVRGARRAARADPRRAGGVGADLAHRTRSARSVAARPPVRPAADGVRPGAAGAARCAGAGRPVRRRRRRPTASAASNARRAIRCS